MSVRRICVLAFVVGAELFSSRIFAQGGVTLPDTSIQERVQRALQGSGMSPAQIRDRLRAGGYSEGLLDAFMGAGRKPGGPPSAETFAALRSLGVLDSSQVDSLRSGLRPPRVSGHADSLFVDSIARGLSDSATREAIRAVLRNRAFIEARADSGFRTFGQDVFANQTTQFDPLVAGSVGPDYRVGPGDQLTVILTGQTEAAYQLGVTREGMVVIPSVGPLPVANLTMAQLERLVVDRLSRVYSQVRTGNSHVTISMVKLGTIQVSVLGDVRSPGSYQMSRVGTVLTALYAGGGPSDLGSMRVVELKRGGRLVGRVDLYDYLLTGSAGSDLRPENGDVIFVPPRGAQVRVAGAVLRPATYELRERETLADAIRMAGGFRPTADRSRVQIERILPPAMRAAAGGASRTAIDISSPLLASGDGPPIPLEAGDIIRVRGIPDRVANRILVSGNVWSAGQLGLKPGMRLSEALRAAGGIKPGTYLETVQISRLQGDSTRRMLRTAFTDTSGTLLEDLVLEDADEIRIFSSTEFRPDRYVTVSGSVRRGGRIAFREGMTLRDALLLAGGTTEGASLNEAIIGRIPDNALEGRTTVSLRVPLDSAFGVAGLTNGHVIAAGMPPRASTADNVVLQPYDHVLIQQQPGWGLPRSAVILGEVQQPGRYALESKGERLRDLINKAGGLTKTAYAGGIVFIRTRDLAPAPADTVPLTPRRDTLSRFGRDTNFVEREQFFATYGVTFEEFWKQRKQAIDSTGRIGIDLREVMKNPRHPDNLILVDGDSIVIPVMEQVVHIAGAVQLPTTVAYKPGEKLDYYIRLAGGGVGRADVERAYVAQPNGRVEARGTGLNGLFSPPEPQPGSTVYVPLQLVQKQAQLTAVLATTATFLSSLITLIVLTRR